MSELCPTCRKELEECGHCEDYRCPTHGHLSKAFLPVIRRRVAMVDVLYTRLTGEGLSPVEIIARMREMGI